MSTKQHNPPENTLDDPPKKTLDDSPKGSKDKHPDLSDPSLIPSVGKGSKKRGATCPIEEFARQLEANNRSLESFMLLGALGRMPSKNISYCCLMSSKSFEIYNRLVRADKMDKWRDQITPSTHSQDGLEGFKESINVNWKELFMGVTKLKILLTDSCEVFKKLEKLIAKMKTLQAVICMNKQGCKCYGSPLRKTFIRELSVVPNHENNNIYFADVARARKTRKPNPRFHYFAKIYYRNEGILTKICSTELPSDIQEELKNSSSKNPKTMDE
uniref:THAP-type domain-containing protein n=1 Tax=Strongyloides papillosus TaxID=174720 RepID=A0A0N5BMH7_STREA